MEMDQHQLSMVPYEGAGGGKYKECMRNHAAAMGGQAFDGCGEYMPSSPDALKCAACGCHRSFHRRVVRRCCCRDDDDASAAGARRWRGGEGCSPESSASSATPR